MSGNHPQRTLARWTPIEMTANLELRGRFFCSLSSAAGELRGLLKGKSVHFQPPI
jgi:hypothetical protein